MQLPKTPNFRLAGKRALVVGANSGIGTGCALVLADAGAQVVLAARRKEPLDQVVNALQEKGLNAKALLLDVSDVQSMKTHLEKEPVFDILVNSAGTAKHSPATETTTQDFDAVMSVNLRGAYFLSQIIAKRLIQAGKTGSLINISSQMGHIGGIERAVYCASKHAVEGFTKAMAIEFGPHGIRVNTICPTFIQTPLTAPTLENPQMLAKIKDKIKLGRLGKVEDVMGAVVYLASDAATLVTGSALMVDGGWTAG